MAAHPRVLCISGSPRTRGNSQILAEAFAGGASAAGAMVEMVRAADLKVEPCRGCLRCNVLGKCAIRGDDFARIAESFCAADGVLFASPVYFHHVTAQLKTVLDRFRSMIHVRLVPGPEGLVHTPRYGPKRYALVLAMGAAWDRGVKEVVDLVEFIAGLDGSCRKVDTLVGRRLALTGQVAMDAKELEAALAKLGLDPSTAPSMLEENRRLLDAAAAMGARMASGLRE